MKLSPHSVTPRHYSLFQRGIRIPLLGSKLVSQRMAAIAEMVCDGEYDIVVFQEVWSTTDYVTLSIKILDKLPYTHYYYGGYMTGGVCLFSKYPILETMYHNFPLNGHAHKLLHGDWYGAKGCGLCVLKVKEFTVNVYSTHMHARYNHTTELDEYLSHRACQAFSLSQFVKHTSKNCDAVFICGDFNSTPNELTYKIIRSNAVVNDAWLTKHGDGSHDIGATSDTCDNIFTLESVKKALPDGQRIDYIFYRANDMADILIEDCQVLKDKVPGESYNYSDHFAVAASLQVRKNITAHQVPELNAKVRGTCIDDLVAVMDKGISKARYTRYFYFVVMLLALMILLLTREHYLGDVGAFHVFFEIIQGIMALVAASSFWISAVLSHVEQNAHLAQKQDLINLKNGASHLKLSKVE